jgi:DNA-binding MarR family transcriptional regulator
MSRARQTRKTTQKTGGGEARDPSPEDRQSADRLHSTAIHLLRKLRRADGATGLSAPRLSALSVIVFAGPINLTALAAAEQVRAPSMSRLVRTLEADGLVRRRQDSADGRVVHFEATPKGTRILSAGRARRVDALARALAVLQPPDRAVVRQALDILEATVAELSP